MKQRDKNGKKKQWSRCGFVDERKGYSHMAELLVLYTSYIYMYEGKITFAMFMYTIAKYRCRKFSAHTTSAGFSLRAEQKGLAPPNKSSFLELE